MADTLRMPSARAESASSKPEAPTEKMIPLKLRRGYWGKPGTKYKIPHYDADGIATSYTEGEVSETGDEMARKNEKLLPGYFITLPESDARKLVNQGKAEVIGF